MTIDDESEAAAPKPGGPPAFNVPGIVIATIAVFALIHAVRVFLLNDVVDERVIIDFAFIPGCYTEDCAAYLRRDGGALFWSPLSHAFLHGDWTHLGLNTVWLLAFGTPVARRLGWRRFTGFAVAGAVAGAGAFYALNPGLIVPVIGASGVVSAVMGGACRFAFASVGRRRGGGTRPAWTPLLSISGALRDRTVVFFILIFLVSNVLTGAGLSAFLDGGAQVAWEAHVGGFLFGYLCLGFFDRPPAGLTDA